MRKWSLIPLITIKELFFADKAKTGKDIKMKCKGDEYLQVAGITINKSEVDFSRFPELHPDALEWECSKQKADEIKTGKSVKVGLDIG